MAVKKKPSSSRASNRGGEKKKHEKTSYFKSMDKIMCNNRNIFCPAHLDDMGQYGIDNE